MSNPRKATGTAAESAVVKALLAAGIPAERRALTGSADQGDIWALGGEVIIEVKSRRTAHTPGDVERWLQELDRETIHAIAAGAPVSVSLLVVKRVGSGAANAGQWHCYARPGDAAYMLTGISIVDGTGWVMMPLALAVDRLRGLAA